MRAALVVGLVVAVVSSGCGVAPGCDFRQGSSEGPKPTCKEATGLVALGPAYEGTCKALGAKFLPQGCPRQGAVGGCQESEGGGAAGGISWIYEGTVDDVKAECAKKGEKFVAP